MDCALILGSNSHRARWLRFAISQIAESHDVISCAQARRTRDEFGRRYLNLGLRIRCSTPYAMLKRSLQAIEDQAGRRRGTVLCTLDVDIVLIEENGNRQVLKPSDLSREYVRSLLGEMGFTGFR